MILLVAVGLGVFLGLLMPYDLNSDTLPYVAIALIAALDSVFGGIVAYLKKKFKINIFISGFFTNAILAAILTYFGNKLGINLSFAAIVVFGTRIFNNVSTIRHLILDKMVAERERVKRQEERRHLTAVEGIRVEREADADADESDETADAEESVEDAADSAADSAADGGESDEGADENGAS